MLQPPPRQPAEIADSLISTEKQVQAALSQIQAGLIQVQFSLNQIQTGIQVVQMVLGAQFKGALSQVQAGLNQIQEVLNQIQSGLQVAEVVLGNVSRDAESVGVWGDCFRAKEMTRPKIRITFEGAQSIFSGVQIEKVFLGGKLAGYKATRNGKSLDSTSLGDLCTALWEVTDGKLRQYEEAEAEQLAGKLQG